jgi:hypothetical protein
LVFFSSSFLPATDKTIHAYPSGGGACIVDKENLGTNGGLVAEAALLVDQVLTVAVSIAAGVAAVTSIPWQRPEFSRLQSWRSHQRRPPGKAGTRFRFIRPCFVHLGEILMN